MFDSVVAAVSPQRARLAGPAAALAHGLVFAGLIGAALWNAAELPLPDPPERISLFSIPIALSSPAGGAGGGGRQDTPAPRSRPKAAVQANSFPTRLPDEVAGATGPELTDGTGPRQGQVILDTGFFDDGDGTGSGTCPSCRGTGSGVKSDVIDGTVVAPILIRQVEPIYPETLRKVRQEGRVVLEAIIARNGSIEEIRVVSSANALFDEAAVKAVGQWRYEPCLFAGRPVSVRLLVTVIFRLN
jgi:TonB family protein